jgi:hypothetical protein
MCADIRLAGQPSARYSGQRIAGQEVVDGHEPPEVRHGGGDARLFA